MKILGLKFSHDAGVAVIEDGKLLLASEIEKINNNSRYSKMTDISQIKDVIKSSWPFQNTHFNMPDYEMVIDGWTNKRHTNVFTSDQGYISRWNWLPVASYNGLDTDANFFNGRRDTFWQDYYSYSHLMNHLIGSYVTAPWSASKESCYVIASDGGIRPSLYAIDPNDMEPVQKIKTFTRMTSSLYGVMALYFGRYKKQETDIRVHTEKEPIVFGMDIPGKVMSYIALGEEIEWLKIEIARVHRAFDLTYDSRYKNNFSKTFYEHKFMERIRAIHDIHRVKPESVLRTIHAYLQDLLVQNATESIPKGSRLILTGGAALNIKWNSALRETGHFKEIWVPPFPNDSGQALGAAASRMALRYDHWSLDWNVYCGVQFEDNLPEGYPTYYMDPFELGKFIAKNPKVPVLTLYGAAEIGPRALGHRSILMHPGLPENKDKLNEIKGRESFRPVAPVALEEDAAKFFAPGTPDPYMIFEHRANDIAFVNIPATIHLDGTCRLQTVPQNSCNTLSRILEGFKFVTGFGIMCNTSANFNGSGFLPDMHSAIVYAKNHGIDYIWTRDKMVKLK